MQIGGVWELLSTACPTPITRRSASLHLLFRFVRAVKAGEARMPGRMTCFRVALRFVFAVIYYGFDQLLECFEGEVVFATTYNGFETLASLFGNTVLGGQDLQKHFVK